MFVDKCRSGVIGFIVRGFIVDGWVVDGYPVDGYAAEFVVFVAFGFRECFSIIEFFGAIAGIAPTFGTAAEHVDKDRGRSAMAAGPAVPAFVAAAAVPAVPAMAESNIRTER